MDFILFKFIFLIIFFFCSKDFFIIYFKIITDGYTDRHNSSIDSREFETIYSICHYHRQNNFVDILQRVGIKLQ
jgi:hypothetical protein